MSINKQIEKCSVFYLSNEKVTEFGFDPYTFDGSDYEFLGNLAEYLTQNISEHQHTFKETTFIST